MLDERPARRPRKVKVPSAIAAGASRRGMSAVRNSACAMGPSAKKATKTLTPIGDQGARENHRERIRACAGLPRYVDSHAGLPRYRSTAAAAGPDDHSRPATARADGRGVRGLFTGWSISASNMSTRGGTCLAAMRRPYQLDYGIGNRILGAATGRF